MTNVIHKDLSYTIMAAVFEVHNILGPGFLEKVYERALLQELKLQGMNVAVQKELKVRYKDIVVGTYIADLIVDGEVLLEQKAVASLSNLHQAQVLHYLKATGLKLGLLVNFGQERVEYKRLVF